MSVYRPIIHTRLCNACDGGVSAGAGCPFTFKKSAGRSHPFGKNVTYGSINNTPEKCKRWCLVRSYCLGVDFAVTTSTCYFLREINDALLVSAPTVDHFEKTRCARQSVAVLRRIKRCPCVRGYFVARASPVRRFTDTHVYAEPQFR